VRFAAESCWEGDTNEFRGTFHERRGGRRCIGVLCPSVAAWGLARCVVNNNNNNNNNKC